MDFLLILFIAFLLFVGLPILFSVILYKWLNKLGYRKIAIIISIIIVGTPLFIIYTALYPPDSFYFEEFEEVTLRKIPSSADIINKSATYPDPHGSYFSASLIRLSPKEYEKLYKELNEDKLIIKNEELIPSPEFYKVMEDIKTEHIRFNFGRRSPNKMGRSLYIGFLDDKETIVVQICQN